MYKLDKIGGGLVCENTGILLKPTSEKFEKAFVQYLIRGISDGRTLSSLLPTDASFLPSYPDVVDMMEKKEYKILFTKAEMVRRRRYEEDLHEVAKRAKEAPTRDNIQLVQAFSKVADQTKEDKNEEPITIEFPRFLPKGFWGIENEFSSTSEPHYKGKKRIK